MLQRQQFKVSSFAPKLGLGRFSAKRNSENDKAAGDHILRAHVEPCNNQAIAESANQTGPDKDANNVRFAAKQACAAENDSRNRR